MDLEKREKEILSFIIDNYLNSGEPTGSRFLVKKYDIPYSPATVRNIMSDLESDGYIEKSHTSSGRVPTSKGYKFFINSLLELQKLSQNEISNIRNAYNKKSKELDSILTNSTEVLSKMTDYASFAIEPNISKEKLKKIELIYINSNSFLAVIVTNNSVKTKRVVMPKEIDESDLNNLSKYINNVFKDQSIGDISIISDSTPLKNEVALLQNVISQIEATIHLSGKNNLITQLSKNNNFNLETFKMFNANFEMKEFLEKLVDKGIDSEKINIVLGDDLGSDKLKDLSFVFSTYDSGDSKGVVGIIGPKRMKYSKIASVVEEVTKQVQDRAKGGNK